jgi:UPF0716 protein FxsA
MTGPPPSGRRRGPRRRISLGLLAVAFVVVPLVEIYFIIQVGQTIGALWTIALLVADSILGSWLVKHEGGRAWRALNEAISTGTMPARELADAALILVGGTLMLTPGFVTDAVGFLLILPVTRPVARRLLTAAIARRFRMTPEVRRPAPGTGESVVRGEAWEE